jgi:hypothetical protein
LWCADGEPAVRFDYGRRPALAGITGGRRWWTVSTISRVSILVAFVRVEWYQHPDPARREPLHLLG